MALETLAGSKPQPRRSSLRRLRSADGSILDDALILWLPGPSTATGEDVVELHLHGGRAVVAAVESALGAITGLRRATPGEFTRRAFSNGRLDLAEAEGLADLLSAETELQRRQAMALVNGELSILVGAWRLKLLALSARIEALLDFGDEDDVDDLPSDFMGQLEDLSSAIATHLERPRAELVKDGFRVVLAGPPNSGKSSLFNRLVDADAAITSTIAGTTRDVLSRPVAISGVPFVFADTAGLRTETPDAIEAIGIERARSELENADLVLWLGDAGEGRGRRIWEIESFSDLYGGPRKVPRHVVSSLSGDGVADLLRDLVELARDVMPQPGTVALNARQRELLAEAVVALQEGGTASDILVRAECLRVARLCFDRLLGTVNTEAMLDALFGQFCIGK